PGYLHTVALKSDGTLWAWGGNYYGQLGDGTTTRKSHPTQIGSESGWKALAVGMDRTVALKSDGTLWAWGNNSSGWMGGQANDVQSSPIIIGSKTDWSGLVAGMRHSLP
ncbi:MAG: hypothetical protein O6934_06685, partial [SAR324 cluster bacterium]|nr:hypothetical protein [SAR324 cluster bacterium]